MLAVDEAIAVDEAVFSYMVLSLELKPLIGGETKKPFLSVLI